MERDFESVEKALTNSATILAYMDAKGESWVKELGEKALELVADYPLYASSSNITYAEAIGIATLIHGNILEAYAKKQMLEKMSLAELKAKIKEGGK